MSFFSDIRDDLKAVPNSVFLTIFSNRGFHSLLVYRLAKLLFGWNVPLLPMVLTRVIQVLYGIDISYKSDIAGGVCIVHGVGVVIGNGVCIKGGVKIYHGVTLGIRDNRDSEKDGFPTINKFVLLGAGCCVLGPVVIGEAAVIGANSVVVNDVPAKGLAVGVPAAVRRI